MKRKRKNSFHVGEIHFVQNFALTFVCSETMLSKFSQIKSKIDLWWPQDLR